MSTVAKDCAVGRVAPEVDVSDETLLLRYQATADRRAFEELVRRYQRELYSYLRRYLGDAAMAEDAFQTTFLQMHLKCAQFDDGRKVRPWLYAIATNQAIDAQRRNRRHRMVSLDRRPAGDADGDVGSLVNVLASSEATAGSNMEFGERRDWVRQAVEKLPDPLRKVVTLLYFQGLKYSEVAEVLGLPVGTIKSRMHAATYKLSQAWSRATLRDQI